MCKPNFLIELNLLYVSLKGQESHLNLNLMNMRAPFFILIVTTTRSFGGMWQIETVPAAMMSLGLSKITETFKSNPNYFLKLSKSVILSIHRL